MTDSSYVLPLPTTLVLLLHLHILSYPQCNAPEYSPMTLFALSRPLRDRTKTMEDIVAFLIEKIEGKVKRKSILGGTYPCLQPSDTVAFRVNVAKYMDTLRATVIRQSLRVSTSKGRMPTGKALQAEPASSRVMSSPTSQLSSTGSNTCSSPHETSSPVAWWWSAIVVRKSLLEECSGDRFEKLLLALSTHALFVQIPSSSPMHPLDIATPKLINGLRIQPREYASLLSRTSGLHTARAQSVSRLNNHAQEFISLRDCLARTPCDNTERVGIQRLLAIRESKRQDLVDAWQTISHAAMLETNEEQLMTASNTLKWILSIAGVSTGDIQREEPPSSAGTLPLDTTGSNFAAVQTLPTASAHHPANMHKLRSLPSFVSLHPDLSVDKLTTTSDSGPSLTPPVLQELLHDATIQKAGLRAALNSAVTAGRDIARRLDVILNTATTAQEQHVDKDSGQLDLWTPVTRNNVLKAKVSSTQDLSVMRFLSDISIRSSMIDDKDIPQRIEASVLALRESLQPRVLSPSISNGDLSYSLESPHQPTPSASTKPQSSTVGLATAGFTPSYSQPSTTVTESSHLILMPPKTPRPYETSTPPPKSHSKTVRAIRVAESRGSDTDSALLTPTDNRGFFAMRTDTVKTPHAHEMIADMSLPDFSDNDVTDLGIVPSQEFETTHREWHQEPEAEVEQAGMPYEGHSVTLRDILLSAGDGEDSFHLIDDLEDLDEGLGNETIGWG